MSADVETDQEPGTLHPRLAAQCFGHEQQEGELANALAGPRLHHAWLFTGPKGVGKATLAYRFARRAMGAAPAAGAPLASDPADPVCRQIGALSHPDMFVLRRAIAPSGKPRQEITAEDARALPGFFALKSASGGRRVAIVDCVDDLNRHAANALLKALEEPPAKTLLVLICHTPGAALATIRSRCRRLRLHPLAPQAMMDALAALSPEPVDPGVLALAAGRPGRALALGAQKAGPLRSQAREALAAVLREGGRAFSPLAFQGGPAAQRLALLIDIVQDWIESAQAARLGSNAEGAKHADPALVAALAVPGRDASWAEAWQALDDLRSEAEGLDLDPALALARIASILDRACAPRP